MQKAAKLALGHTLALQQTVLDLLDSVGKDVKTLLNGTIVPDSVLLRHTEQEVERKEHDSLKTVNR
jgi:hypothetical protein